MAWQLMNSTTKWIKGIFWKIHDQVGQSRSGGLVVGVCKKSTSWSFDPIISLIKSGSLVRNGSEFRQIETRRKELVDRLSGEVRKTSFRHEMTEMDAGKCASDVSSPAIGGRLVYHAIKIFKPQQVVELGSAFGIGTLYIASALSANKRGFVTGIEYEGWRAEIADEIVSKTFPGYGEIRAGRIEDVLPTILEGDRQRRVDFAFVDAVHKYDDTLGYHRLLRDRVSDGAVVIYDDINWSDEMRRFWSDLIEDEAISDALLINNRWGMVRYGTVNGNNQ